MAAAPTSPIQSPILNAELEEKEAHSITGVSLATRSLLLSKTMRSTGSFTALLADNALWNLVADADLESDSRCTGGVDYFKYDLKNRMIVAGTEADRTGPESFAAALCSKFIPIKMLYDSAPLYIVLGLWRKTAEKYVPAVLKHIIETEDRDGEWYTTTGKSREVHFTDVARAIGAAPQMYFSMCRKIGRKVHTLYVQEYAGASLAKLVATQRYLKPSVVVKIFIQIAQQLVKLAEADVRHGDIKLENVCVRYSAETDSWIVRLIDYGMSSSRKDPSKYHPNAGTEDEQPPERREGNKTGGNPVDPEPDSEDSWGLGSMLWHVFEFSGSSIPHPCIEPGVFSADNSTKEMAAAALLMNIMVATAAKNPSERQSVAAALEELRHIDNLMREHRGGFSFVDASVDIPEPEGSDPFVSIRTDLSAVNRFQRTVALQYLPFRYRGCGDVIN